MNSEQKVGLLISENIIINHMQFNYLTYLSLIIMIIIIVIISVIITFKIVEKKR